MEDWDETFDYGVIESPERETEKINHRITPIIFMIDTSNYQGFEYLTSGIDGIITNLADMNSSDNEIRYAILCYSDNCDWITSGLQSCGTYYSEIIAGNLSCFNCACHELNMRLNDEKHGLFNCIPFTIRTPSIIILISSKSATDGDSDGKDGIADLKQNKYFVNSYKLAIAIGDDANQNLCINFTGDKELVFSAYNEKALRGLIHSIQRSDDFICSEAFSDMDDDSDRYVGLSRDDKLEPNMDWDDFDWD